MQEEERSSFRKIEEIVEKLLIKYEDLKKERDESLIALQQEREKAIELEKKLEIFSLDKEKVKTRIDQLLHRLQGIDL